MELADIMTNIKEHINAVSSKKEFLDVAVNTPFETLIPALYDIGTIVLLYDNKSSGNIERLALSETASSVGAVSASAKPFHAITIPRDYNKSAHVRALKSKKPIVVTDWFEMFTPALSARQAKDNQMSAGINTSIVQPYYGKKTQGTIIFSLYKESTLLVQSDYDFFSEYAKLIANKCDLLAS